MQETVEKLIQEFAAEQAANHANTRSLDKKTPNLGWLAAICKAVVFVAMRGAAKEINDDLYRDFALFGIDNAETIAELLTDSDKENLKQITAHYKDNWQELCKKLLDFAGQMISRGMKEGAAKVSLLKLIKQGLEQLQGV